jgi:hypothetical protein
VRILKNAPFRRFAEKQDIPDEALIEAVERAENGQIDADLGGRVIKQRVARRGQGKRDGFRTIILYRSGNSVFFVHGFSKSDQSNITSEELQYFKKLAALMFALDDKQIDEMVKEGVFWEVRADE